MPRFTRAVPVRPVGGMGLVISDTVKFLLFMLFPTMEAVAADAVRNDAFLSSV
jgi:hypothetical protein